MSDGVTHGRYATAGIISISATAVILNQLYDFPPEIYWVIPGTLFAFLIDSDTMDEHSVTTVGEHRWYKLFRPLGFVLQCYTYPLALLLTHRSIYSHLPGLNTSVRILYYLFPALYFIYGYGIFYSIYINYFNQFGWFFVGSMLLDVIHACLDSWNFVW